MDREVEFKEETLIAVGEPLGAIVEDIINYCMSAYIYYVSHHLEGLYSSGITKWSLTYCLLLLLILGIDSEDVGNPLLVIPQ